VLSCCLLGLNIFSSSAVQRFDRAKRERERKRARERERKRGRERQRERGGRKREREKEREKEREREREKEREKERERERERGRERETKRRNYRDGRESCNTNSKALVCSHEKQTAGNGKTLNTPTADDQRWNSINGGWFFLSKVG
jgi:hypothetical protein